MPNDSEEVKFIFKTEKISVQKKGKREYLSDAETKEEWLPRIGITQ